MTLPGAVTGTNKGKSVMHRNYDRSRNRLVTGGDGSLDYPFTRARVMPIICFGVTTCHPAWEDRSLGGSFTAAFTVDLIEPRLAGRRRVDGCGHARRPWRPQ